MLDRLEIIAKKRALGSLLDSSSKLKRKDLKSANFFVNLNSYGTEREKYVETVKTLHVKFFPSGSLLPNDPVAIKDN